MVALAYLFPVIAILILKIVLRFNGEWTVLLWVLLIGEFTIVLLHIGFFLLQILETEYLGSLVKTVHFEESWTELIETTEYKKDSHGTSYAVRSVREKYHPRKYYFHTTRNTKFKTDGVFYKYVLGKWGKSPQSLWWSGNHIKGGKRYGECCSAVYSGFETYDNPKWVSITEKHKYINPIKNSNSIFRFIDISNKEAKELGLYFYPEINQHDAPSILYDNFITVPDIEILNKFRRFNAAFGPQVQMRLYILIFDYMKGIEIAEKQKLFWKGGNKNEFVICLGLTSKNEVKWSYVFSWSDEQNLEVETSQWFLKNKELDLNKFYDWFLHKYKEWKRKEFTDFNYLSIPLKLWQLLTIYIVSILENIIAINIALGN
ncbi:MAG: hypothetical protein J1E82_04190 [Muribaculaceae bacterium]|nr:hypothetical protein [Muribaculaceae bacterium]